MIDIRPIHLAELTTLRKIAIETYDHTFASSTSAENNQIFLNEAYSLEQLTKELHEVGSRYYLAWHNGHATGYLRLRLCKEVELELGTNTIELQRLYIHPDHQGKKIGSLLMKTALDYALANRFDWIWLGVWEYNFRAQAFYKKYGFEKFSQHVFQVGDDPQIDWLLRKKLF